MSTGTCTLHTWNDDAGDDEGDPPIGVNYDSELEDMPEFNQVRERMSRPTVRSHTLRPDSDAPPEPEDYL